MPGGDLCLLKLYKTDSFRLQNGPFNKNLWNSYHSIDKCRTKKTINY